MPNPIIYDKEGNIVSHNKVTDNSQKFFFSKNSNPIQTVHYGDVYELKSKQLRFNRYVYCKPAGKNGE